MADPTPANAAADMAQGQKISRYGWYALTLVSAAQAMSLLDRQILSILFRRRSRCDQLYRYGHL